MRHRLLTSAIVLAAFMGCGPRGSRTDGPFSDAALDAPSDVTVDTASDTKADETLDVATDAALDAADASDSGDSDDTSCGDAGITPVVLATQEPYPYSIVLDGDYVYFTRTQQSLGAVRRVRKDGTTAASDVATGQIVPRSLVADPRGVAWLTWGDTAFGAGSLMRFARTGAPEALVIEQNSPYGLATDGSSYFLGSNSGNTLAVVPSGWTVARALDACHDGTAQIVADDTYVYTLSQGERGALVRITKADGAKTTLVSETGSASPQGANLAVHRGRLYWTDRKLGTVLSIAITGGGLPTTIASGEREPFALAVDDDGVWFTTLPTGLVGEVRWAPLAGGSSRLVARTAETPVAITTDAQSIYWSTQSFPASGSILRATKPGPLAVDGCFGPSVDAGAADGGVVAPENSPAVRISGVIPFEARVGSFDLPTSIEVVGITTAGAVVDFDGAPLAIRALGTRTVSALTVSTLGTLLPKSALATAGTKMLTVTSGAATASFPFRVVTTGAAIPTISSINPTSLHAGAAGQTAYVFGQAFACGSSMYMVDDIVAGAGRGDGTKLDWQAMGVYLSTAGTFPLFVVNPTPGGGAGASYSFTITGTNPIPSLGSATPSSIARGSGDTVVTLNGANLLYRTTVTATSSGGPAISLGHCAANTNWTDHGRCSVTIPRALLASATSLEMRVTTAAPGGGSGTTTAIAITP